MHARSAGSAPYGWQKLAANGNSDAEIGFQLLTKSGDQNDLQPTAVSIGSTVCAVTTVFTPGAALPPRPPVNSILRLLSLALLLDCAI